MYLSIHKFVFLTVIGCALLGGTGTGMAGTWTLNVENDRIANTDRHYSNGVRAG